MKGPQLSIAVLVENNYQELEVWYPIFRLLEAGATVTTIGPEAQRYMSKLGYPLVADRAISAADPQSFDAVIVPGGYAPDLMRLCEPMISFVRDMDSRGAIVASICHGAWLLASAGILKGRRITGAPSIADDLRNAGGIFEDAAVVRDANIISSRKPADIPFFSAAIMSALSERKHSLL